MRWLLLATAVLHATSAFTVHQHSTEENCVDLQCPAAAFDYGIRNLVSEETLRSDKCMSCEQCTSNGYSLCLRLSSSRGRRGGDQDGCSCTHSVPANCHNELSNTKHPANITMSLFHVCYVSALQAPPRPLAVNEKGSVIVTVESFWHEPYWRDLHMENLTLNYEFIVQKPEHCEGILIKQETNGREEHFCKDSVHLEMSGLSEEPRDDDYEHSENYEQYDDSLPPEVQFDRDVFDGAKLLKVFYTVEVRRPRQLTAKGNSDPFRDVTTTLESEVLKFDLKPEIFGTGFVPELPAPTEDVPMDAKEDEENISEEHGDGTDFFVDDARVKDTKSEELLEKEESDLEKKIAEIDSTTKTSTTTEEATTTTEEEEEETTTEKEVEKITQKEEKEEEETTTEAEEETTTEEEEAEETTVDEQQEDQEEKDEEETTETAVEEDENNDEEEMETTPSDEETTVTEGEEEEEDGKNEMEEEEEREDIETATEKTIELFGHKFTKWHLSRYVFGICLISFLLIVFIYCCRKSICCCCKSETKTTSNGYRYNNPNRTNELVCSPEKERLHQ